MDINILDCKEIISRYTNYNQNVVFDFSIEKLSETALGFLGDHYKLTIKYESDDKNRKTIKKNASFFLKTIPRNNIKAFEYITQLGVFEKECSLYKNVFQEFSSYHATPTIPQCYLVKENNLIILEDLTQQGYYMYKNNLNEHHLVSVVKCMARFHASSIIFEETRSVAGKMYRIIDHFANALKEATFVNKEDHPRYKWARNVAKSIADSIALLPEYNSDLGDKLMNFVTKDIFDYILPSTKFRNVICHSDLWKNNIMFIDSNCVLVDFQLARYTPGAFDVLTTLYLNATPECLLKYNYRNFLDIYYETFVNTLSEHKINCENVISKSDFDASVKLYTLPALVEATMFATIIFISPELSKEMLGDEKIFEEFTFNNRSKYVLQEFRKNKNFKERYVTILTQLLDELKMWKC